MVSYLIHLFPLPYNYLWSSIVTCSKLFLGLWNAFSSFFSFPYIHTSHNFMWNLWPPGRMFCALWEEQHLICGTEHMKDSCHQRESACVSRRWDMIQLVLCQGMAAAAISLTRDTSTQGHTALENTTALGRDNRPERESQFYCFPSPTFLGHKMEPVKHVEDKLSKRWWQRLVFMFPTEMSLFLNLFQLAHVLPTEENFLLLFRCQQLKSCEEFMKV